jgi:hypothetical protein
MDIGFSMMPWVFSPGDKERELEMRFLREAGFKIWRIPVLFHPTWFPDTLGGFEHLQKCIRGWARLGGVVIFTLFNISPYLAKSAKSEDIGEVAQWMFGAQKRWLTGDEDAEVLEALDEELDWFIEFWRKAKEGFPREAGLGVFYVDVWNGAEGWQWERWEVPRWAEPFWRYIEAKTRVGIENKTKGLKMITELTDRTRHVYIGTDGYLFYDSEHRYGVNKRKWRYGVTEAGVSLLNERDEVLPEDEMFYRWGALFDRLWQKQNRFVCFHSLVDGRFRHLTYDKGSCRALWVAGEYEKLLKEAGKMLPHYDAILWQIQTYLKVAMMIDESAGLRTGALIHGRHPYE